MKKRVVIVGGGFGGVEAARNLAKYPDLFEITLVSKQDNFLYYPALYQLANRNSTYFSVLRVADMLPKNVHLVIDEVLGIKRAEKKISFFKREDLEYDTLVLALGSVTEDFGTPGVRQYMCQFRTLEDIYCLHGIIHEHRTGNQTEPLIVIGGGPTGVELAARIATIFKKEDRVKELKHEHVVIIEASPTVVAQLPKQAQDAVLRRLTNLGIGIYTNTLVKSYDGQILETNTGEFASSTAVWAAGLAAHPLLREIKGEHDKKGRIVVNEFLESTVDEDIFVIGDSASTKKAGLAQTAIHDGKFAARSIMQKTKGLPRTAYQEPTVGYAVPLGKYWAIASFGPFVFTGILGFCIRQAIDFHYILTHVSFRAAWRIFVHKK